MLRNSFLFNSAISLIGAGLVQITTFPTLLIGRFIQGICVGIYSSLCPLFVK
jgi:MFS family permease